MTHDLCFQDTIRLRYSFPRIQWLIGAMAAASTIYLTSEEIWKLDRMINAQGVACFIAFFLTGLILIHYLDMRRAGIQKKSVALAASLASIAIDVSLISLSELIVLYAIQMLPQDILNGSILLLMGALPFSMGSIVLSSLTSDVLRKRARRLYEEAREIRERIEKSETRLKRLEERIKADERKYEKLLKEKTDS